MADSGNADTSRSASTRKLQSRHRARSSSPVPRPRKRSKPKTAMETLLERTETLERLLATALGLKAGPSFKMMLEIYGSVVKHIKNGLFAATDTKTLAAPLSAEEVDPVIVDAINLDRELVLEAYNPAWEAALRAPPPSDLPKDEQARLDALEGPARSIGPSAGAQRSQWQSLQGRDPILNGRPPERSGPPIALFHSVFDDFERRMNDAAIIPTGEEDRLVQKLFTAALTLYNLEDERSLAVEPILNKLVKAKFESIYNKDKTNSAGVIIYPSCHSTAFLLVREDKNEIGEGGSDPSIQGALSYRHYVQEPERRVVADSCCCPCFIMATAGPHIWILGGVLTDAFIVQPLAALELQGGHEKRLVAYRVLRALSQCLRDLVTFYEDLSPAIPPDPARLYPRIQSYPTQEGVIKFSYQVRLTESHTPRPVYKARDEDGRDIVIKFVQRYGADAHRILAKAGLAPKLYYNGLEDHPGERCGGLAMVVMEFVDGDCLSKGKAEGVATELQHALKLLHDADFVFGDLRPPNIIVDKSGKAKLIDFDWCAKDGVGTYPADLNEGLEWPPDVKGNSLMHKSHDTHMLRMLLPPMSLGT